MFETFKDVNLNEDPIIVLKCGHAYTISTLDGTLEMDKVYSKDMVGDWHLIPLPSEFLQLPCCPDCRKPIRMVYRYGRICNRASMNVAEKQFLAKYGEWCSSIGQRLEKILTHTDSQQIPELKETDLVAKKTQALTNVKIPKKLEQYLQPLNQLHQEVAKLTRYVNMSPQTAVFQSCSSHLQRIFPSISDQDLLQKEEMTKLSLPRPFLTPLREVMKIDIHCKLFKANVFAKVSLVKDDGVKEAPMKTVAFQFFKEIIKQLDKFIRSTSDSTEDKSKSEIIFLHLECRAQYLQFQKNSKITGELELLEQDLNRFLATIAVPSFSISAASSITALQKKLQRMHGPFYEYVTEEERRMIFKTMNATFMGGGHWYTCPNGHIYTIGECGMAMQRGICPECQAPVGGGDHTLLADNRHAHEIERQT